jgi:hypothetical protein
VKHPFFPFPSLFATSNRICKIPAEGYALTGAMYALQAEKESLRQQLEAAGKVRATAAFCVTVRCDYSMSAFERVGLKSLCPVALKRARVCVYI